MDSKDCYGYTPLHYATRENSTKVALVLIKNGANVNLYTDL